MEESKKKSNRGITIVIVAVVILLLAIYSAIDPADSQWGRFFPKCPVKMLTGLQCPGCGIQRAGHHLLQGDVGGALAENWFLPFSLSYLGALLMSKWLLPETSRVRRILWGKVGVYTYIALYLIWFVVRNILGV